MNDCDVSGESESETEGNGYHPRVRVTDARHLMKDRAIRLETVEIFRETDVLSGTEPCECARSRTLRQTHVPSPASVLALHLMHIIHSPSEAALPLQLSIRPRLSAAVLINRCA